MSSLSDIFTSRAKVKTLEVMLEQSVPIALRRIEDLALLPIRSISLAVEDLVEEGLLVISKHKNRKCISIAKKHAMIPLLRKIFQEAKIFEIQQRATKYAKRAEKIVSFNDDARLVFESMESKK